MLVVLLLPHNLFVKQVVLEEHQTEEFLFLSLEEHSIFRGHIFDPVVWIV
jgi:hypothetical protein